MSSFPEIHYQRQLITACLDDFCPNDALSNYMGGQYGNNQDAWKNAVIEFLGINIDAGLIQVIKAQEKYARLGFGKIKKILEVGCLYSEITPEIAWNIIYFEATDRLIGIVESFNINNWRYANGSEIEVQFMNEINGIYMLKSGVTGN